MKNKFQRIFYMTTLILLSLVLAVSYVQAEEKPDNIADSAITVGIFIFILHLLFKKMPE